MTITGICGEIGSGKSFLQLQYALEQCALKHKILVCNFAINPAALKKYAVAIKSPYLIWMADNRRYVCISALTSLADLMKFPGSVVCLDEAGIFLNSREFSKTPKSLLTDLAQSRKDGIDLIYCAQFDAQVDLQFRQLTQFFVYCDALTSYDPATRRPRLVWKYYSYFKANAYWHWISNPKARASAIRTWIAAFDTKYGPLSPSYSLLFGVFDSFCRLDFQASSVAILAPYIHISDRDSHRDTNKCALLRTQMIRYHKMGIYEKLCYPGFFRLYLKYFRKQLSSQ